MKPGSHVQYRSCFRVKCTKDKTLGAVRRIIYEWLKAKEPDSIGDDFYETFKKRCHLSSMNRTRSSLTTDYCFNGTDISWAMHYEHRDSEHKAKRFWYTDVGLRIKDEELIIATTISYAFNENDISGDLPVPPANVPNFIRTILSDKSLGDKYVRKSGHVLLPTPLEISDPKKATVLPALLQTRERLYAWLVVSGDDEHADNTARDFAHALAGKCQVIQIKGAACDVMDRNVPFECQVRRDFVRVFFPTPTGTLEPSRQRWFNFTTAEFAAQRHHIINGLLRNLPAYEPNAVWNVSAVRDLLNLTTLSKQLAEISKLPAKDAGKKVEELVTRNSQLEASLIDARNRAEEQRAFADGAANDIDALEQDIANLRAKNGQLEHALMISESRGGATEALGRPFAMPTTLGEACELFGQLYAKRVVILPQALREAGHYEDFKHIDKAWDMLNSLAHTLHDMRFSEPAGMSGEWNKRFHERTGFELAISEGKQTKADPALMRLRKVSHGGKAYDIEPHIKWGNQRPKMLRIHYAFEETNRLVIIGYVGPHMTNYTTKMM